MFAFQWEDLPIADRDDTASKGLEMALTLAQDLTDSLRRESYYSVQITPLSVVPPRNYFIKTSVRLQLFSKKMLQGVPT